MSRSNAGPTGVRSVVPVGDDGGLADFRVPRNCASRSGQSVQLRLASLAGFPSHVFREIQFLTVIANELYSNPTIFPLSGKMSRESFRRCSSNGDICRVIPLPR
jgi:hypothetical protein